VKGKFSPRGKAFARSKLLIEDLQGLPRLFQVSKYRPKEKAKQGLGKGKDLQGLLVLF
jgi:hypothetical protein